MGWRDQFGPKHPTSDEARQLGPFGPVAAAKLEGLAKYWASRFDGPVYLIGSCLHSPTPRDIDLRVLCPDDQFFYRFGFTREDWGKGVLTQRWIDDNAKMNRYAVLRTKLNMDVQVWPAGHWSEAYASEGHAPPLLLAEPSPRWWLTEEPLAEMAVAQADGAP